MKLPKIVSLFSGAGGLDLGYHKVGFPLAFAVDSCPWAIKTHKRNFPKTFSLTADLVKLRPNGVLRVLDPLIDVGESIGVIGGPPCQGFSRANTRASADDPRNDLPFLYLEIVAALQEEFDVQFVLFENVVGIRDTKHSDTFSEILSKFDEIGFVADVKQHSALDYGVPQTRNRVIISGFANEESARAFAPKKIPGNDLTVASVLRGLPPPVYYARNLDRETIPHHPNHWTMRPISRRFSQANTTRLSARSFRRLNWDKPSPTVAYGHREIHVHPNGKRRLTIYEAMLLQGFPHDFVLEGTLSAQVEQVSNAVPPPLATALARATKRALSMGVS